MNRAFFRMQYNMELVTVLKNFKASIDSKVENSRQDNGSRGNYSQVVAPIFRAHSILLFRFFKVARQKEKLKWGNHCRCGWSVTFDYPFAPLVQK